MDRRFCGAGCQLGWIDGRTIAIEYRWSQGRRALHEIAAEFVRLKVDVIVTNGTAPPQ